MESVESVITKSKLHLQIHGSISTHRQLEVIVPYQGDKFSFTYMYNFGEVHTRKFVSVFGRLWSPSAFPAYYIYHSQYVLDFIPLSIPFSTFGAKRHGTAKMNIR